MLACKECMRSRDCPDRREREFCDRLQCQKEIDIGEVKACLLQMLFLGRVRFGSCRRQDETIFNFPLFEGGVASQRAGG